MIGDPSPDLVCLGEALVELNEIEPGTYRLGFGGDTSNCAVAAARLGARAGYVSALGADEFGDRLRAMWADEGVDASRVARRDDAPTGIYFISHGPDGHRFTYRRAGSAASRMRAHDVPEDYVAGARVLHVSAISQAIGAGPRAAVERAVDVARAAGVTVAYDTNLRLALWDLETAREVVLATAARADVVLPGLDDARALLGLDAPEAIAHRLRDLGAGVVALTLGAGGALVACDAGVRRIPGHRVASVDASGAGDAFDGAFLARRVEGADPFAAAEFANAAAALSTTGYGAVAPLPRRAAVERLLGG